MVETVHIRVDASRKWGILPDTWNCIGYDECNYTHSPGGLKLLADFASLGKTFYVRAHHMLCNGILHAFYKWGSTNVYTETEDGTPFYTYDTIDRMVDIWLSNHCKPFFELGFMPRDLADPRDAENGKAYQISGLNSEYQRKGWAMPPKDYLKWFDLIYHLILHLKQRYGEDELGTWYFEMWNEPDIFYWRGTREEFFKLYDYTEAAVHKAMPELRFGGPATCGNSDPQGPGSCFLRAFLDHTRNGINFFSGQKGTRLDFISFHSKGGNYVFDALAKKQLPSVQGFLTNIVTETAIVREFGYDDLECILSEADPDGWAAGGRFDNFNLNFRNTEYYASYVISAYKNLYDLSDSLSMKFRPFAWAFMFEAERCFEGTRTFSTQGISKAVFNLFRMLSRLDGQRVFLSSSRDLDPLSFADPYGSAEGPEVDGWAVSDGHRLQILLYCHHDDWDLKDDYPVNLSVKYLPFDGPVRIVHYRIDSEHSNPCAEWIRQGSPDYPSEVQRKAILDRSGLEECKPAEVVPLTEGQLTMNFILPVHGISLLEITPAGS